MMPLRAFIRLWATTRIFVVVLVLAASTVACRTQGETPFEGVLTINLPEGMADATVRVTWWPNQMRRPTSFPARIEVPLRRPVSVGVYKKGYDAFERDVLLTQASPRQDLVVELSEPRPHELLGYRPSEIPKSQLDFASTSMTEAPATRMFSVERSLGRDHQSVVVDDTGAVWFQTGGKATPEYVGRIEPSLLEQMKQLRGEALANDFGPREPGAIQENGPSHDDVVTFRQGLDAGERLVLADAISFGARRRLGPSADRLIKWLLAVERETIARRPAE
jgi:hypothetical protein